ncbi:DNA nickase [compost metagenome]
MQQLYDELNVHAQIEETIFYPAFGKASKDQEKVDEALEEHRQVKQILSDLIKMQASDQGLANKVSKLKELVQHHVREEEGEMFPEAREHMAAGELNRIGEQLDKAKAGAKEKVQQLRVTMAPEAPIEARRKP